MAVGTARAALILVIKRFRLKQGADEVAFVEADHRLQHEFTSKQPGIIQCTTAKTIGGEWLVLHLWTSTEAADAPSADNDPVVEAWVDFIDESTATMTRFESIE